MNPPRQRTYAGALKLLNSRQTGLTNLELKRNGGIPKTRDRALLDMRTWLRCLGYSPENLDKLNIIHVAGSKGKSTTCAYIDAILNESSAKHGIPQKVACYTSPHVESPRERLKFGGQPISEDLFTKYVYEVWDLLQKCDTKPVYFRFLTLVFFHACFKEEVDATILEVGVGGEFDSTNIILSPKVTVITTLALDHTKLLGENLSDIAWHKGGIMKSGVQAYSVQQKSEATKILREREIEKAAQLEFVSINPALRDFNIQPAEEYQYENASIALRASWTFLETQSLPITAITTAAMCKALEETRFPGKLETIQKGKIQWNLDGSHTKESLTIAGKWIGCLTQELPATRILVFNHQTQRDAIALLNHLYATLGQNHVTLDRAFFTTNVTNKDGTYKQEFANYNADNEAIVQQTAQHHFAQVWKKLDPCAKVQVFPTIEDTFLAVCENDSSNQGVLQVFVIGSNHLVGGMRYHIDKK